MEVLCIGNDRWVGVIHGNTVDCLFYCVIEQHGGRVCYISKTNQALYFFSVWNALCWPMVFDICSSSWRQPAWGASSLCPRWRENQRPYSHFQRAAWCLHGVSGRIWQILEYGNYCAALWFTATALETWVPDREWTGKLVLWRIL